MKRSTESGFTLIELLVTIAIMGIAVVGLVGALMTGVFSTDVHRKESNGDLTIRSWSEAIARAPYAACNSIPTSYTYVTLGIALPAQFTASAPSVKYWDKAASTWTATCGAGTMQLVTIGVASGNRDSETLDIVKMAP